MEPLRGRVLSSQSRNSSRAASANANDDSPQQGLKPLPRAARDLSPMTYQRHPSLDVHSSPGNQSHRARSRSPGVTLRTASATQHSFGLQQGISPSSTPFLAPSDTPAFVPSFNSPFELQGSPVSPSLPQLEDVNLSPPHGRSNSRTDIPDGSRPSTPIPDLISRPVTPTDGKPSKRRSWLPGKLTGRSRSWSKPHEGPSAWLIGLSDRVKYDLTFLTTSQVGETF